MRRLHTVFYLLSAFVMFTLFIPPLSHAAVKDLHPKVNIKTLKSYEPKPAPQEKDIPTLTEKAKKGDMAAQEQLGYWYIETGQIEKVKALLQKSAEAGDAAAQYIYAFTFAYEHDDKVLTWVRKAAAQNYIPAISFLARASLHGESTPSETLALLYKAASLGDAQSAQELGKMYLVGKEVAHDGVTAYVWLYLAQHGYTVPAKNEREENPGAHNKSLDFLAWTMTLDEIKQAETILAAWPQTMPPEMPFKEPPSRKSNRSHSPKPLTPKEVKALKSKAEAGDNDARLHFGAMLIDGAGVKKDTAKGMALIKQAAAAGHEATLFVLAELYQTEKPFGKDLPAARKIYEQLAAKGNTRAQVELGILLLKSAYSYPRDEKTVLADAKAAQGWYEKAAKQGDPYAMAALAHYYDYHKKDKKLAATWYEKAASLGYIDALNSLIGIAEQNRSAKEIYQWCSTYMSVLPASDRVRVRSIMMQFAGDLSADEVLQLKKSVAAWLKKSPKLVEAARANMQAEEETGKAGI